jgi:hypothetical protein
MNTGYWILDPGCLIPASRFCFRNMTECEGEENLFNVFWVLSNMELQAQNR